MAHLLKLVAIAAVLAVTGVSMTTAAQQGGPVRLELLPVQGQVSMLAGAGTNLAVQVGSQGVLLVDTPPPDLLPQVLAEIRRLTSLPVHRVINTNGDPDHVGSNADLGRSPYARGAGPGGPSPGILSHELVSRRLAIPSDGSPPMAVGAWPAFTYDSSQYAFQMNGEAVVLFHEPAAHTDGDSMVHLRRSDVIAAGDVYTPDRYPMIDIRHGGSVNGMIGALQHLLVLTVPSAFQEGGTYVIPGHGRLGDEADVVEYRDMLVIVRDRVQDLLLNKKMTLEQVKAARPTFDYDAEYGATSGPWTTDMFVEAVYQSLKAVAENAARKPVPSGNPASQEQGRRR